MENRISQQSRTIKKTMITLFIFFFFLFFFIFFFINFEKKKTISLAS